MNGKILSCRRPDTIATLLLASFIAFATGITSFAANGASGGTLPAAVIPCRNYDVRNGLSENSVRFILQDREGYMWFGTKDGLSRYNGRDFKVYGNSTGSGHLNIESLLLHSDGDKIWVASRYSLELLTTDSGTLSFLDLRDRGIPGGFRTLCYDAGGRLWVGSNYGIAVLEPSHSDDASSYTVAAVYDDKDTGSILCDRNGTMWVGTSDGLFTFRDGLFKRVNTGSGKMQHFLCISEDANGIIWAGTWDNGLYSINPKDNSIHNYFSPHGDRQSIPLIRSIFHSDGATMIICSNTGLYRFDKNRNALERLSLSTGLDNDSFYHCLRDTEGGLWIGTYFNGVCYISPRAWKTDLYRADPNSAFTGTAVSEFCSGTDGKLWVATENGGLSLLDRINNRFIPIPWHDPDENIHALKMVGNDLWVGSFNNGLKRIDLKQGTVQRYRLPQSDIPNSENSIYSIHYSQNGGGKNTGGAVFIGAKRGCARYDYATGGMEMIPRLDGYLVYDICEDYTGKIWFSCHGDGVLCYDEYSDAWKHYRYDPDAAGGICSDRIIKIYSDLRGHLWFCSEGNGICRYDYTTDSFSRPKVKSPDGNLPCNVIFGILDDPEGNLWMSSNAGIIRLNPVNGEYRLYTHEDGLQSNQFNYRSVFRTEDGRFWFGGVNGFNSFYPEDITDNTIPPKAIAHLYSEGRYIRIDFDCLSFVAPQKNIFEYRLNNTKDWIRTGQPSVTFADLKPGKYHFQLRAINSDGYVGSPAPTVNFTIKAPWYSSIVAICIYTVLLVSLAVLGIHTYIRIRRRDEAQRLSDLKLRNEQEAYNSKIQFFTQVANEIKTPVTLIKTPLESIITRRRWDRDTENNLKIIEANTARLTDLTSQLLGYRKFSNTDADWLSKIDILINEHLSSIDFSIQQLAEGMFTSRSALQRKMKTLTGMTPNEYVKQVRLKRSAEYLLSDNYRINEVCYMCGFNTPSYFTSCFYRQYGILPKDFVALHRNGQNTVVNDADGRASAPQAEP